MKNRIGTPLSGKSKGFVLFPKFKIRVHPWFNYIVQGNHLLFVTRRAVTEAHAHAAQPDGRDFQITFSKLALLQN
jgi:hypothetical protein